MKCFSVYPEVAEKFCVDGEAVEEYRGYPVKYRGDVLVACTATDVSNPFIFAHGKLTDCYEVEDGVWAWLVSDCHCIKPLPVRGQQRLYNVDYTAADVVAITDDEADAIYDEAEATWLHKGKEKQFKKMLDEDAAWRAAHPDKENADEGDADN